VIEREAGSRCAVPAVLDCFDEIAEPARTDVEIHRGNTYADSEGCLLLGMWSNSAGVWDSRTAMRVARKVLRRDDPRPPSWGLCVMEAPDARA
jgi:hypothetical protein